MVAPFGSEDRLMCYSRGRSSDSWRVARATYNLWWPLAIIDLLESSTIVGFYALSYLVTPFDRHPCAAKLYVK